MKYKRVAFHQASGMPTLIIGKMSEATTLKQIHKIKQRQLVLFLLGRKVTSNK